MAVAASKLQLADSTQHCCWSVATLLEYTYFSKEIKQLVQKARSPTFYTFSLNSDNPQLCNTSFICTFITCEIAQLYLPPLLCFAAFECRVEQILHFASHYLLCCFGDLSTICLFLLSSLHRRMPSGPWLFYHQAVLLCLPYELVLQSQWPYAPCYFNAVSTKTEFGGSLNTYPHICGSHVGSQPCSPHTAVMP